MSLLIVVITAGMKKNRSESYGFFLTNLQGFFTSLLIIRAAMVKVTYDEPGGSRDGQLLGSEISRGCRQKVP